MKANGLKAPFPYFGGKARVADRVWAALGQPAHYIEPFFGSGAVLLNRPDWMPTMTETINDADGHIANVWRSIQHDPDTVARWCDWPVNHADLISRKKVLNTRNAELLENLCRDDDYYDAKLAGYWVWAASCWIGSGLACPGQRPHIGKAGMGVHAKGKRPHIGDAGMGVHAKGQIPHIGDAGMGVHDPHNTNLYAWMRKLSERLRNVRVVCGDWTRVCGGKWQDNIGLCGMFFDPPYCEKATRANGIYSVDSQSVAHDVRKWCLDRGDNKRYRIVLAGYYEEHDELLNHGWRVEQWRTGGGYAKTARNGVSRGQTNRHREALFLSPHCLAVAESNGKLLPGVA